MMIDFAKIKVAIVHYWFVGNGGGERVVEALAEMFPQADIFCLLVDRETLSPRLRGHVIQASFLQSLPGARRWYKALLPFYPIALEHLDLSGYDLVLSSESGPAKGVLTPNTSCHICYCHSPMRYLWDLYPEYRRSLGILKGSIFALSAHYLRMWDVATAKRVSYFVANSNNVASRIRKHYDRDATVIYPPVSIAESYLSAGTQAYYLIVSRLVEYKRVDLAIQACTYLSRPLRVIGDGYLYKQLRKIAGPTIEFLGRVEDREVREHYANCKALLFPGEEDFGIVPVEAQSFGRPVIAYGKGGALETVRGLWAGGPSNIEAPTGVFFERQTTSGLVDALRFFEMKEDGFSSQCIRESVERFNAARFKREMADFIERKMRKQREAQAFPFLDMPEIPA